MNFTSFVLFLFVFVASLVSAAPIAERDVFVPPILKPAAGAVWTVNSTVTVKWDVSDPPAQITNGKGSIRLRKAGSTLPLVLADGFNILDGHIKVKVPWVTEGTDYEIVLFGDSGNFSPAITITGGPEF